VEHGALSGRYISENEWLRGVSRHLKAIINVSEEYVGYWNLEEEAGITPDKIKESAEVLLYRIDKVLMTPLGERGPSGW
jgi:hypothetical protein